MQTDTVGWAGRSGVDHAALERIPPIPGTLEETGLSAAFVSDLVVKTLYVQGGVTGERLSGQVLLPFPILDERLLILQQRRLVEVRGVDARTRRSYVFDLTGEGRIRARELLEANAYVGPAPVPNDIYWQWVALQSVRNIPIGKDHIRRGLGHLVLDDTVIDHLGPGLNSGRSVFLHGHPGNGKTETALSIAEILGGSIFVPHAVEIEGQMIRLYDPHVHTRSEDEAEDADLFAPGDTDLFRRVGEHDLRFVRVRRPGVIVGGELTLDELDLQQMGPRSGVFIAPPQLKANGGVFVIDDFGRQRVRPRDLLNRWMIPLDRGTDYLGLPTGHKLKVPFDCLVFFATNLNPADLVEEAFLRRIRHKIHMPDPTRDQFTEIMRRVCRRRKIPFSERAVTGIFDEIYSRWNIEPRSCHPGDIVAAVCDHAQYLGVEPSLDEALVMHACRSYFIDLPGHRASDPPPETEVSHRG